MKIKIEGLLKAITPIFHGGDEKTGSTPVLRTISLYDSEKNSFVVLPYISGNSIRGKLRRLIFSDLFQSINYEPDLKEHHIFYSGGVLESSEAVYGIIDLDLRKKLRENIVPLSLFGASIGNQVIPGKMQVGHAFPVCEEYRNFLPEKYRDLPQTQKSVRLFADETFITRRAELTKQQEDEEAVQMKVDYECFIPGTVFYHWFALDYPNSLELSCFARLLELFYDTPFLGGRSSQGDGQVEMNYNFVESDTKEYLEYLKDKERILGAFQEVQNLFKKVKNESPRGSSEEISEI